MTEVAYGSKYKNVERLPSVEIAKLIRADIKAAIKAGDLPEGIKVSVVTETFSGGSSIDINIKAGLNAAKIHTPAYMKSCANRDLRCAPCEAFTEEGKRILGLLQRIHASYNFNGSDSQSDYFHVNYYGRAEIGGEYRSKLRAECAAIHNRRATKPRVSYVHNNQPGACAA
jgi:hypothetical protein